jgi:trans-aconitate methyltransferase
MSDYTWNAADYDRHAAAQRRWAAELLDRLRLEPGECVLDIGCGDGKVTAEIARRVPAGSATGSERSPGMVAHAHSAYSSPQHPNLRFLLADARDLPFHGVFEVVFSNAALHWVQGHSPVLKSIARSLRPGGRLLLQMGGRGNAAEILQEIGPLLQSPPWKNYFIDFKSTYGFHGPEEYDVWLAQAGLRALRNELIPKDMVHHGQAGLEGWIRTTWMPYTQRVPAEQRENFIGDLASRYIQHHPADEFGAVHVRMVRLEVEAVKP